VVYLRSELAFGHICEILQVGRPSCHPTNSVRTMDNYNNINGIIIIIIRMIMTGSNGI